MPVGFDTVDFTGILNFLSEHKARYSPSWTLWGGGAVRFGSRGRCCNETVSQCCLNIVDNSVKFLFMNISV